VTKYDNQGKSRVLCGSGTQLTADREPLVMRLVVD
jgi:hypothetical protein